MNSQKTILVIDDEIDLVDLLEKQLKTARYNVLKAYNGIDGLALLQKNEPDLIILDMNMPKMGGIEFYNKICEPDGTTRYPVFVLTGRANMEQLFRDFHVAGFIAKPFEMRHLLKDVEIVFKRMDQPIMKADLSGPKNVLIIDNNSEELNKIKSIFAQAGYTVETSSSGSDAVEHIMKEPPDIAVVQLGLTDIPGDLIIFRLLQIPKTKHVHYFLYLHRNFEHKDAVIDGMRNKSGVEKLIQYIDPEEILDVVNESICRIEDKDEPFDQFFKFI